MLDNSTIGSLISSSKEGSYESKEFMMKYNNNKNPQLYKLFCECVSFHLDAKSDAVFYKILLKSQITNNEWELNRRYSDFSDFRLVLEYNFSCLPSLPSKTLTKVTSLPELESRKGNLNKFLKVD